MSGWSSVLPRLFRQGYFHQQQKGDDDNGPLTNGPLTGRAVLYHSTERNNNHEKRNEMYVHSGISYVRYSTTFIATVGKRYAACGQSSIENIGYS